MRRLFGMIVPTLGSGAFVAAATRPLLPLPGTLSAKVVALPAIAQSFLGNAISGHWRRLSPGRSA